MRIRVLIAVLVAVGIVGAAGQTSGGATKSELKAELATAEKNGGDPSRIIAILDTLGRMEFAAGNYAAAKRYFFRELKLTNKRDGTARVVTLTNLAQACLALGESRESERHVREALTMSDDPQLWYRLGQALLVQGNLSEAEAAYRNALARAPAYTEAWSDLAALVARRKGPAQAAALLREALPANPTGQSGGRMLRNLAVFEWKAGDRDAAVEHFK